MGRVVITGLGMVTPLGLDVESTWDSLIHGKSGVGPITKFDASAMPTKIGAEVKGFNPEDYFEPKEAGRLDLFLQYAIAVAAQATRDASLNTEGEEERVGVITGCGLGGITTIEHWHKVLLEKGPKRITPFFVPMIIANMSAGEISIRYNAKGPNMTLTTACAAGTHAVGQAYHIIRHGIADVMIAGGVESTITPLAVGGFNAMRAISKRNDEPQKASRPFDRDRDGFVIGEGAGILILESLEHALARGADIYAEIIGFGMSGDAFHIAAPAPDGEGAKRCMAAAISDAGIVPEQVDYINAHGTSTDLNDVYETMAIKAIFKEHAYKLCVSATKSMTGHLLGAAGGIEAVFTALTIKHGIIPPTINLDNPDPQCDLDYVPHKLREKNVKIAISNSFGFGGTNASIVLKAYEK